MFKKRSKAQKSNPSTHRGIIERRRVDEDLDTCSNQTQSIVQEARSDQLRHSEPLRSNVELDLDEQWEDEQLSRNGVAVTRSMDSSKYLESVKIRLQNEISRLEKLI